MTLLSGPIRERLLLLSSTVGIGSHPSSCFGFIFIFKMARTNKKLSPKKLSPQKKKTATNGKVIKRRRKPGSLVTREIKFYQNNTNLLIRKLPFARYV